MNLLVAAAIGIGLGIATGMPLGVINVAIVEAATSGNRRFATGVGIGGAIADSSHALLAFIGVGQLVTARPDVVRMLAGASVVIIVGYAILVWRRRAQPPRVNADVGGVRAVVTGVLLTLPNPAALSAWIVVATALWPSASLKEAIVVGLGVGLGSATWFAVLARLAARIPRDHRALRIISRVALVVLCASIVAGIVRVL